MRHRSAIRRASGKILAGIFALALANGTLPAASYFDTNGFTTLWATTANLNGSGVVVMQAEAELSTNPPEWEVNPAAVGQPASLFTYYSTNGPASSFPNSLGAESSHADAVGGIFYGSGGEATNVAAVYNYEADYFAANFIEAISPANINSPIVNQSFTFGAQSVSDQQSADSDYDDYAARYSTLFISAVNNGGQVCAPGTSYDCIGVGDYGGQSSIGPTIDNGRCKPDIIAPASETSYSTPQVAGAAAVLLQAALRGDGGGDSTSPAADMRTLKALLLNGAVKPAGWTNSSASPLDARYGAGLVNIYNSYRQLTGGQHDYIASSSVPLGAAHPPTGDSGTVNVTSGWDFNTATSSSSDDGVNHYYFNATSPLFIATLVWNRQQNQDSINNLFLFLYNAANSNLVGACTSAVDNVQHLFMTNLPAGRYDLQVLKTGGIMFVDPNMVSDDETYALAFEFSQPALSQARSGSNVVLTWPLYPAGLLLSSTTSLNPPAAWTAVNPSPPIVNGRYQVTAPITGDNQFFQLRQP